MEGRKRNKYSSPMRLHTIISVIIMIAGIFILGYFTRWWIPVIWIIIVSLSMRLSSKNAIVSGALCLAAVWGGMAKYHTVLDEAGIIAKTGEVMGGLSPFILLMITLSLGLVSGGLAGWFGAAVGALIAAGRNYENQKTN
jgi:hypothetical protein